MESLDAFGIPSGLRPYVEEERSTGWQPNVGWLNGNNNIAGFLASPPSNYALTPLDVNWLKAYLANLVAARGPAPLPYYAGYGNTTSLETLALTPPAAPQAAAPAAVNQTPPAVRLPGKWLAIAAVGAWLLGRRL